VQFNWDLAWVRRNQKTCAFCRLLLQTLQLSETFGSLQSGTVLARLEESDFIEHKTSEQPGSLGTSDDRDAVGLQTRSLDGRIWRERMVRLWIAAYDDPSVTESVLETRFNHCLVLESHCQPSLTSAGPNRAASRSCSSFSPKEVCSVAGDSGSGPRT